jgi:hypothetical protein
MHSDTDFDDLFSVLRPFLLLAGLGFAVGFFGYWAMANASPRPAPDTALAARAAVVALPAPTRDNPPKMI